MKKRIKLFSSALAIGMLLGTGVGAMSSVAQHVPGTTVMAKASTSRATLTADQLEVDSDGYITGLKNDNRDVNAGFIEALKEGHLTIPSKIKVSGEDTVVIKGILDNTTGMFSKDNLIGVFDLEGFGGLKTVTFEDDSQISYIGEHAFENNQLTDVALPESVKVISIYAFQNNQLQNVKLNAIEYLYGRAFAGNKIKTVSINKDYENILGMGISVNNPYIFYNAFENQNWDSLTLPYSATISSNNLNEKLKLSYAVNNHELNLQGKVIDITDNNGITQNGDELSVTSKSGGNANVTFSLANEIDYNGPGPIHLSLITGSFDLTVDPERTTGPTQPGGSGGSEEPDTNTPETGENNGNETKPQPAPKPEERRPHTVYAKRGMRLHRNVSLTSPIRSYKKQSRAKAANFRVRGIAYDKNGKKRYKVDGGYITAGSSYVADSHFRSNKIRQVRVLSNRINSYKDVKLSSNKKVRSYKKGTKLRVKRVVNWGRATRFELTNGRYITGNKQLLIMDQK